MDRRIPCTDDPREVPRERQLVIRRGALVGLERAVAHVYLVKAHQPNEVQHPGKYPHRPRATTETEQVDPVAGAPSLDEKAVGGEDVVVEAIPGREPDESRHLLPDAVQPVAAPDGTDAGRVPNVLVAALFGDPERLENVRDADVALVFGERAAQFVAGSVAQHDEIAACPRRVFFSSRWHGVS